MLKSVIKANNNIHCLQVRLWCSMAMPYFWVGWGFIPCSGRECDDKYPMSSTYTQCGSKHCLAFSAWSTTTPIPPPESTGNASRRFCAMSQLLQMFLALLCWWARLSKADHLHWWSQVHQRRCYKFLQQPYMGWWKPACYAPPWLSAMLWFQHVGRVSGWMCYWAIPSSTKSHCWCILEFSRTCAAWALGRCATPCVSKHVVSTRRHTTSCYSCGSRCYAIFYAIYEVLRCVNLEAIGARNEWFLCIWWQWYPWMHGSICLTVEENPGKNL